jgi:sarcosine oxidase subunit gamma
MFEPVTATGGASYSAGIATVRELGPRGMISLRGDLSATALRKAVGDVTGLNFPDRGTCNRDGDRGVAWMSPDELLLMCPYGEVTEALAKIEKRMAKVHGLAVNVSDARTVFQIAGPGAREVIAKLAPVDMSPQGLTPGMFRRTRMAQVAAAFWMREDGSIVVVCFRSVGQYMFDLLKTAAQPESRVRYF